MTPLLLQLRRVYWLVMLALILRGATYLHAKAAAAEQFAPVRTTASFSAQRDAPRWSAPIKTKSGREVYVLSLVPDYFAGGQIEGVDLVLRRTSGPPEGPNLLEPVGNWHGLQDYMFPANGFATNFVGFRVGDKRYIPIKRLGLVLRLTILNAKVSGFSVQENKLDSLSLQVEVENLHR